MKNKIKYHKLLRCFSISTLVVLLVIISCFISYYLVISSNNKKIEKAVNKKISNNSLTFTNSKGEKWHISNPGKNEFKLGGKIKEGPKIVKATIDPLKVSMGQTQTMSLEVNSDKTMDKVIAEITTDHKTIKVELKKTNERDVTYDDIKNSPFVIKDDGEVVLASDQFATTRYIYDNLINKLFEHAKAASTRHYTFSGDWMVHDTGETTYRTKFIAYDIENKSNSVTLAWSDPCSMPLSKNVNWASSDTGGAQGTMFGYFKRINGSITDFSLDNTPLHAAYCDSSALIGVENMNYRIPFGTTITLSSDQLVLTPGKHITIEDGSYLNLPNDSSTKIVKGYLWLNDVDNDNFFSSSDVVRNLTYTAADVAPSTGGTHWRRKDTITNTNNFLAGPTNVDCDDNNIQAYPGQTQYFSNPRSNGSYDYDCTNSEERKSLAIAWYPGQYGGIGYWTPIECIWVTGPCHSNDDSVTAQGKNTYAVDGWIDNHLPACGESHAWRTFPVPSMGPGNNNCLYYKDETSCNSSPIKQHTDIATPQACR